MEIVLFVPLPFPSHYIPTFGLAKKLQEEGFEIIYTGLPNLKELIEKEGFKYEYLPYTESYNIISFKVLLGFFIKSILDEKHMKQKYKEFFISSRLIHLFLQKYQPAILFIDDNLAHYYLLAKNHAANIVLLNTRFFARKVANMPPLDSSFIPSPTFFSKIYCEWLWFKHLSKRKIKNWIEKVAFLGNTDEFYLKRYCKKNGIDWKTTVDNQCTFLMNIKNVASIILSPSYLEFSNKPHIAQDHYLFLQSSKDESQYFTEEYRLLIEKIRKLKPNTKLLYCSFGTLAQANYQRVSQFIHKIVNIVSREKNWFLVVSTGGIALELEKKDNIHLFNYLPQLDMLKHCDLIITHSGTGTIRECVQMGVPMLAYPLNLKADHAGNAARVVANGFGLRGDMEKDSEADIMRKINILLTQPFRKHQEVDSEEKVMEILAKIGISLPEKVLTD